MHTHPVIRTMHPDRERPSKGKFRMTDVAHRRAPVVNLQPNLEKILAAISHTIAMAESRRTNVTQYDILKTLFVADKTHLNEYGRPITFDNYVAMKAGPVPSLAYDLLKENKATLDRHHIKKLPWDRQPGPNGRYYYSKSNPEAFQGILSESDTEKLYAAFLTIISLTFGQIKRLTHSDPAYIEAWDDDDKKNAYKMSLGMLFDSPDFEQAEALEFLSKHT